MLEGAIGTVPWGREGSTLALVASAEHMASGVALVSLNPAETPGVPVTTAIGEPTTAWTFSASKVNADAVVALPHVISGDTVLRAGALFRVALIAGALERVLDLTIEHAREREQFGRPIARFQAVQQEIAQLAGFSAAAGAALEAAVAAVGEDLADPEGAESAGSGGAELAVAAAKARASAVVAPACAIAHQIHAAIGFTREHALHRFTRRLWTWRDQFGSEATWWQRVGQAVRTAGGDGLWSLISGT